MSALKYVFLELIGKVLYFPVWWYSNGTKKVLLFVGREISGVANALGIVILLKNLLKPMYGDYSKSGRIISFFVRIVQYVFLLIAITIWSLLMLLLFIVWLLLPIIVIYSIIFHFSDISEHHLIKIINAFRK
ncbi:hypothetical protein KKB10_02380 [Patescibacteria group bacterium]|nr:hypothetical protein [Patescibacteria group bacterium]MBU1074661.1 hypothetical protein [Patescibacteria group bacterium]MBU1952033.1 hypothetical protein [Patescibacteria group bacterium]